MYECAFFKYLHIFFTDFPFSLSVDLSGKMFTFPEQTTLDHVNLITPKTVFHAATACVRLANYYSINYLFFVLHYFTRLTNLL